MYRVCAPPLKALLECLLSFFSLYSPPPYIHCYPHRMRFVQLNIPGLRVEVEAWLHVRVRYVHIMDYSRAQLDEWHEAAVRVAKEAGVVRILRVHLAS